MVLPKAFDLNGVLRRKRRMVLSSGRRLSSWNWVNSRYNGVLKKASSIA